MGAVPLVSLRIKPCEIGLASHQDVVCPAKGALAKSKHDPQPPNGWPFPFSARLFGRGVPLKSSAKRKCPCVSMASATVGVERAPDPSLSDN